MFGRYLLSSACSYWIYLSSAGSSPTTLSSAIAPHSTAYGIAIAAWRRRVDGRGYLGAGKQKEAIDKIVRQASFTCKDGTENKAEEFALWGASFRLEPGTTSASKHQLRRLEWSRGNILCFF